MGRCPDVTSHKASVPESSTVDYTCPGSIMWLHSAKSQRTAEGHLRKCLGDHRFDKVISPSHSLWSKPIKNGSFLTTSIHLHSHRPIIILIIFIIPPASLPLSPFPRSFFPGKSVWWAMKIGCPIFSSRRRVGEGQCI